MQNAVEAEVARVCFLVCGYLSSCFIMRGGACAECRGGAGGTCLLLSFCGISALASLCEAGPLQNAVEAQVARVCVLFFFFTVSALLLNYARRGLCRMPWRLRWHVSAS